MNERTTEVLEQYELEVQSKRRGRGAWICETSQGLNLLRESKGTVKRLEFEEQIMNVLQNQKTCRTDQYMRNREGELLSVAEDGTRCVVKEWFSGRECSVQSEAEVVRAVGQIAKLHRTLRGIAIDESWNLGSILTRPAVAEMERHNRELVRTRNYIRKKRRKSDFERAVSGSFAIFYEQAQEAAGGLKSSPIYQRGPKVLAWNGLGGYSFPRFPPSGSCTFSDRKTRNPKDSHIEIAAGS